MKPENLGTEAALDSHALILTTAEATAKIELDPGSGIFLSLVTSRAIENCTDEQNANREGEIYRLQRNPDTYEITVESDVTLTDYKRVTAENYPEDWEFITDQAETLQGSKWVFINPTMEGGGVAMMRPPAVHLMNELGLDAHWYVMEPIQDTAQGNPFKFTKQMHNVSQRMSEERITEEGKALHWHWADTENGPVLQRQEPIYDADFIVIDDPQPAPLIARLKQVNPSAKFIWRNHIDTSNRLMSDPATPQGEIATYLLEACGVGTVDAIVAHPVSEFMHPGMEDKTYFAPATFDHFDNLNRHLSEAEVVAGIEFINDEIRAKNDRLLASGHDQNDVVPTLNLDPNTKRITLIARFDPSKGMHKAMEMGVLARRNMRTAGVPEHELPEVVIVGNGSVDDPDGVWMYQEMLKLRREQYPDEASGIIIMRLKHNYDAMNALMSRSSIIMQTSDAEGLETRVSDAIKHGRPVVVSNRGGIKTQVVENRSGIILDYDKPGCELDRGAEFMMQLLMDDEAYASIVESTKAEAKNLNLREFSTVANVARFLNIGKRLRAGRPAHKTWKMADLAAEHYASVEEINGIAA